MEAHLQSIQTLTKPFDFFHRRVLTLVMDYGPERQFSKSQPSRIQGCAHDQRCCFLRSVIGCQQLISTWTRDLGMPLYPPFRGRCITLNVLNLQLVLPGATIVFCTVFQN